MSSDVSDFSEGGEMADAPDLGSGGATHEGSTPSPRTNLQLRSYCEF